MPMDCKLAWKAVSTGGIIQGGSMAGLVRWGAVHPAAKVGRFVRLLCLSSFLVIAWAVSAQPGMNLKPHFNRGESDTTCIISEVSRDPLVLEDGSEAAVEPTIFSAAGKKVLLAGTPNYRFRGNRLVVRSGIFGAVIGEDGSARAVGFPKGMNRAKPLRALSLGDSEWGVLFAELTRPEFGDSATVDPPVGLWYGVIKGTAWQAVERISAPPSGKLQLNGLSSLTQSGNSLAFALPIDLADQWTDVVVFEKREGRWSFELVPTRRAAYVALISSPTTGLGMAVVQPDVALRHDQNSVFLYARSRGWRSLGKLKTAGARVHRPFLSVANNASVLSFETHRLGPLRSEAKTMQVDFSPSFQENIHHVVTLDSTVYGFVPLVGPRGAAYWVTDHFVDRSTPTLRELRILRSIAGHPSLIATFRMPFRAGLAAAAPDRNRLLISGGVFRATDGRDVAAVTLLVDYRVECRGQRISGVIPVPRQKPGLTESISEPIPQERR